MRRRFNRFVQVVQTDGGSEFEAEFARQVWSYCRQHRIARPYKKNEQAHPPKGHPKASIAPSQKNALAGLNTKPKMSGACCPRWRRFWSGIITIVHIWLSSR